jgi:hypothetical protein
MNYLESVLYLEETFELYEHARRLFLDKEIKLPNESLNILRARVISRFATVYLLLCDEIAFALTLLVNPGCETNWAAVFDSSRQLRLFHCKVVEELEPLAKAFVDAFNRRHEFLTDKEVLADLPGFRTSLDVEHDLWAAREAFFRLANKYISDLYDAEKRAEDRFYELLSMTPAQPGEGVDPPSLAYDAYDVLTTPPLKNLI